MARKAFLVRLPAELLDELRGWAEQEMRSLNGQIEFLLRQALIRRGRRAEGGTEPPESDESSE